MGFKSRRKRGGRRRRKRFNRRRRQRGGRSYTNRVRKGAGPVAPRCLVALKYCQQFELNDIGGFISTHLFRLNSIFSPDSGGTTVASAHQPYGHDQYNLLYGRYRVWKTRWVVRALNRPVGVPADIVVVPLNGAYTTTTFPALCELPHAYAKQVTASSHSTIKGGISLAKLGGYSFTEFRTDSNTGAVFGNSPTEAQDLMVMGWGVGHDMQCQITLTYYCEMTDPILFNES